MKQTYGPSDLLRIHQVPEVRSAAGDRCRTRRGPKLGRGGLAAYGVVVLSVNVSVFA
jgi:hypothetical protein